MMAKYMAGVLLAAIICTGGPLGSAEAQSDGSLRGKIKSFECGDNCYLTIVDEFGKEHTGLCAADACRPWNAKTRMPKRYVGRTVIVRVGMGTQFDGGGEAVGKMLAFRTLRFL